MAVPLTWYLVVAAALFCIGLYGALSRRNAIGVLMGVELMLNSVNVNLLAFWRHIEVARGSLSGQVFAIIVITVDVDEMDLMSL
jgi:NADH-quinone oxidoreductase subunit K